MIKSRRHDDAKANEAALSSFLFLILQVFDAEDVVLDAARHFRVARIALSRYYPNYWLKYRFNQSIN
jgi:hypothetical protein